MPTKKSVETSEDLRTFKASLEEGLKFARGQKTKLKIETIYIRTRPQEVKDARKALHVTQPQFAKLLDVSPETVRKWEQGVNPVPGLASRWVEAALRRPKMVGSLLAELAGIK